MVRLVAANTTLDAAGFGKLYMTEDFLVWFSVVFCMRQGYAVEKFALRMCCYMGIEVSLTMAYWPQANNVVERPNEVAQAALGQC
jgi:hypothetical protein